MGDGEWFSATLKAGVCSALRGDLGTCVFEDAFQHGIQLALQWVSGQDSLSWDVQSFWLAMLSCPTCLFSCA